ncbi:MAG: arsenate reductase ArsC [candidate division WOR-3 bacterium]
MRKKVLFLCTHNSARSQMAEGILNHLFGDRFRAFSAGIEPSSLHPLAIKVMSEVGIDISQQRAKSIKEFQGEEFDFVITVCDKAKETCPFFPKAKEYKHWSFPDPSAREGTEEERLKVFREIRERIREKIEEEFIKEENDG